MQPGRAHLEDARAPTNSPPVAHVARPHADPQLCARRAARPPLSPLGRRGPASSLKPQAWATQRSQAGQLQTIKAPLTRTPYAALQQNQQSPARAQSQSETSSASRHSVCLAQSSPNERRAPSPSNWPLLCWTDRRSTGRKMHGPVVEWSSGRTPKQ